MSRLLPLLGLSLSLQLLACAESEDRAPITGAAPLPGVGELNTNPNSSGNPDSNPGGNPDDDPSPNPGINPGENTDGNPDDNPDSNPGDNTGGNPGGNPGGGPGPNPVVAQAASPGCAAAGSGAFQDLFSLDRLHTVRVYISDAEWTALLNDFDQNPRNEVYRVADFVYEDGRGASERVENIGFRLRGSVSSRMRPQTDKGFARAHFKVKFNERFDEDEGAYGLPSADIPEIPANRGRLFRSVRSLNFKHNRLDPTYLRELFAFDVLHRFGALSPRMAFGRLYIKIGEDRELYFGVYHMFEALDSAWNRRNCRGENGFLFKCLGQKHWPASLSAIDSQPGAFAGAIGMEITDPPAFGEPLKVYRPSYDLKTRDGSFDEAEAELNALIRLINSKPTKSELEEAIDIPALLRVQAVMAYIAKWDGFAVNNHNYYLLLDPLSDKWVFLPYDNDSTFSGLSRAPLADFFTVFDLITPNNSVLMRQVMAIPEFRRMFLGFVAELANRQSGPLHPANARERLASLQALIHDHANGYDARVDSEYLGGFESIMEFLQIRTPIAESESGANRIRRPLQGGLDGKR